MKTKSMALMLAIALIVGGMASTHAAPPSQLPPLPADLLFTTTFAEYGDYPRNVIMRVDAETAELSTFYVDQDADELAPLSWSPQGNLLAVYRILPPIDEAFTLFPRQLCILDRTGVLQRCLDDSPPMHYAGGILQDWQHYFPVVWGTDGQSIYFETEYPNEGSDSGYGRRIVEASVVTGETLRVLYDYPEPYPVTLSPDLNHLVVGFKREYLGEGNPTFLYDLTTGEQIDPSGLVPDLTGMFWTCLPFSPGGRYIAALVGYIVFEYVPDFELPAGEANMRGDLILLLDSQGIAQHIVGKPEGSPATIWGHYCPSWQPDEQAIVFLAYDNQERDYIRRYTLADQQTTTLYEFNSRPESERYAYAPLVPSPDGTYLAFTVSTERGWKRHVAVLYPDGEIRRISSLYRFGLFPLWVPPLTPP